MVELIFFTFMTAMAIGQVENPVTWSYEAKKKTTDTYEMDEDNMM